MTDSPMCPAPVRRIEPGEPVIVSTCRKCGNEIKLAVGNMTKDQVFSAVEAFNHNPGECPGGYHVELGGWRYLWNLDQAINDYYKDKEKGSVCPVTVSGTSK